MTESDCLQAEGQILEASADPDGTDWSEEAWAATFAHLEQCDNCSADFETFVVEPFVRDTLHPALARLEAHGPEPATWLDRLRNWSAKLGNALAPAAGPVPIVATAAAPASPAGPPSDPDALVWAASDCGRVRFAVQSAEDSRLWLVRMKGERSLLGALVFDLSAEPPLAQADPALTPTVLASGLKPVPFGNFTATLDLRLDDLQLDLERFSAVVLADRAHCVTLRFSALACGRIDRA